MIDNGSARPPPAIHNGGSRPARGAQRARPRGPARALLEAVADLLRRLARRHHTLHPTQGARTPLAQRERCWKQLRTSSGASPTARYSSTYRHCQRRFFSSMPSAKSSVSVYSGDQPASLNAAARIRKLVPARPGRARARRRRGRRF